MTPMKDATMIKLVADRIVARLSTVVHGGRSGATPAGRRAMIVRRVRRLRRLLLGSMLGAFFYSSRADASGADQDAADVAVYLGADFLQVGVPSPLGFVVGVADVVAD
jgi:hypothetical protein